MKKMLIVVLSIVFSVQIFFLFKFKGNVVGILQVGPTSLIGLESEFEKPDTLFLWIEDKECAKCIEKRDRYEQCKVNIGYQFGLKEVILRSTRNDKIYSKKVLFLGSTWIICDLTQEDIFYFTSIIPPVLQ